MAWKCIDFQTSGVVLSENYCCDDVICVLSSVQRQLPAVSVLALLSWRPLHSEQYLTDSAASSLLYLCLKTFPFPGLRSTVDIRLLWEGGSIRQKCHLAGCVQGPHSPRRRQLRPHQPTQEQQAALRRQRARRYGSAAKRTESLGLALGLRVGGLKWKQIQDWNKRRALQWGRRCVEGKAAVLVIHNLFWNCLK